MKKHKKKWWDIEDPHVITKHHRIPRSRNGIGIANNCIKVKKLDHRAWHVLFDNLRPKEIAKVMNGWIDPNFEFICQRREK